VLECFAGESWLYRQLWHKAASGATLDKDRNKVIRAAEERPGWACYAGDVKRVFGGPWFDWRAFDVVDIDAWGSPWPFLAAWAESSRARAIDTLVFLTDGYAGKVSLAARCKTLFPAASGQRGQMSMAEYQGIARQALRSRWGDPEVLAFVRLRGGAGHMRAWALRYTADCWTENGSCRASAHE